MKEDVKGFVVINGENFLQFYLPVIEQHQDTKKTFQYLRDNFDAFIENDMNAAHCFKALEDNITENEIIEEKKKIEEYYTRVMWV